MSVLDFSTLVQQFVNQRLTQQLQASAHVTASCLGRSRLRLRFALQRLGVGSR